jgi:hypothetical protein
MYGHRRRRVYTRLHRGEARPRRRRRARCRRLPRRRGRHLRHGPRVPAPRPRGALLRGTVRHQRARPRRRLHPAHPQRRLEFPHRMERRGQLRLPRLRRAQPHLAHGLHCGPVQRRPRRPARPLAPQHPLLLLVGQQRGGLHRRPHPLARRARRAARGRPRVVAIARALRHHPGRHAAQLDRADAHVPIAYGPAVQALRRRAVCHRPHAAHPRGGHAGPTRAGRRARRHHPPGGRAHVLQLGARPRHAPRARDGYRRRAPARPRRRRERRHRRDAARRGHHGDLRHDGGRPEDGVPQPPRRRVRRLGLPLAPLDVRRALRPRRRRGHRRGRPATRAQATRALRPCAATARWRGGSPPTGARPVG